MSTTTDAYFVLREGATTEEQWTWDEIDDLCRNGEFTADTRVFLPDENRWARIEETDLRDALAELGGVPDEPEESPEEQEAREELERDYADALERLGDGAATAEPHIDAGCLASDLGRHDESKAHFQKALERQPFHSRAAREVKQRFPRAEHRSFQLLERPDAAWDNLGDVLAYPLQRGWLYAVVPVALFGLLMFVPGGPLAAAALALLWCHQSALAVASGRDEPPAWRQTIFDPVHRIVLPAATLLGVFAEWFAIFWLFARLGMLAEGKTYLGVFEYLGRSPVFTVALTVCALAYLPAVVIAFEPSLKRILRVLNPWFVARTTLRMKTEYAMTLLLLFSLAVGLGVLGVVTAWVPVAGKVLWAAAMVGAVMMASFILGRQRARMAHLFEKR